MDIRDADRLCYDELGPWLPDRIIDCHVHVTLAEHWAPVSPERRSEIWAMEVAKQQSWPDLRDAYRALFPDQRVHALAFGGVYREVDIERDNEYVLAGACDQRNDADALIVTRPEWAPSVIEQAIARGFRGIKPYPDLAPQGMNDAGIYDFLPRPHLAALDRLGGILMLHLPRRGRLADPENIREVLDIAGSYPDVKIIVAHIGRAYCLPTAERGLPHFAGARSVYFDTSANLNADVFQLALEVVGPDRLLFGSDLPVTLMRGVRDHVGEQYINWTDGDYSWNVNRKPPEEEASYTFYLYESLRALIAALQRCRLGADAAEQILYTNAARLLGIE